MQVEIGNANAIEGYRDANSDDPDLVRYRDLEGQRVTTVVFPEGIPLQEAFQTVLGLLPEHMAPRNDKGVPTKPAWIETDSPGLLTLLLEHFEIDEKSNVRPRTWGNNAGGN